MVLCPDAQSNVVESLFYDTFSSMMFPSLYLKFAVTFLQEYFRWTFETFQCRNKRIAHLSINNKFIWADLGNASETQFDVIQVDDSLQYVQQVKMIHKVEESPELWVFS